MRTSLYELLRHEGYSVEMASDGQEALQRFEKESFSIVIADLKMPRMNGIQLLQALKRKSPEVAVILVTGFGAIQTAVEAMKLGAYDYITKPLSDGEVQHVVQKVCREKALLRENETLRHQLAASGVDHFHQMVGSHPSMQKIYSMIEAIASTKATVFIRGESGTGKGLIARAIHKSDPNRKDQPWVEVSCGALPETMLESEIFGHVRGSFTGAVRDRTGRFELAHGGTIFLDEIDTLTPALQVKLLRVLQDGQFERVGDTKTFQTDVRVIAAMNRDPEVAIREGTFREDLYYRLNVITIQVPPLRERLEDVPLLVKHFLSQSAARAGCPVPRVTPEAMKVLTSYGWPGNIRQLENVIERAVVLDKDKQITPEDLGEVSAHPRTPSGPAVPPEEEGFNGRGPMLLKDSLSLPERQMILDALTKSNWNCQQAAVALGINRATLYNKMKKHGIPSKSQQKRAGEVRL